MFTFGSVGRDDPSADSETVRASPALPLASQAWCTRHVSCAVHWFEEDEGRSERYRQRLLQGGEGWICSLSKRHPRNVNGICGFTEWPDWLGTRPAIIASTGVTLVGDLQYRFRNADGGGEPFKGRIDSSGDIRPVLEVGIQLSGWAWPNYIMFDWALKTACMVVDHASVSWSLVCFPKTVRLVIPHPHD